MLFLLSEGSILTNSVTHNVIPFETKLYEAVVDGVTIADRLLAVDRLFVFVAVSIGQYSI